MAPGGGSVPRDALTLSELAIEAFYPANAHTAMRLLSAVGATEQ